MKMIHAAIIILFIGTIVVSCNQGQNAINAEPAKTDSTKYTVAMVDNKKDPVCGMPTAQEIGDTAHYKGKVYGFCSKECKDEFLKNPDSYLNK